MIEKINLTEKLFLLLMIMFSSVSVLFGQAKALEYVRHLSISDGLAHNGVTSILEDSKGYLWVATFDGLNRYDGNEFKVFKNTIDKKVFISNRIRKIVEDESGNLWIGTDEGVSIYTYEKSAFTSIYSNQLKDEKLSGPIVRDILLIPEKQLAVCATEGHGLLFFNSDNYSFIDQYIPTGDGLNKSISFYEGLALDTENYLFSTSKGLLHFDFKKKKFEQISGNELLLSRSLVKIDEETLLVAGGSGFALFQFKKVQSDYQFQLKSKHFESYKFLASMLDDLGNLWLGTMKGGIFHIDEVDALKNNESVQMSYFKTKSSVLRGSCFAETRRGCWAGSFDKGIFQFDLKENPFKSYPEETTQNKGLLFNDISTISPIDSHRVYLSSKFGGVSFFNTKSSVFEPLPIGIPMAERKKVISLFVDSNQDVWLKSNRFNRLYRLRKGSQVLEEIKHESHSLKNEVARKITEDKEGNIWVGTNNEIYRIQLDEKRDIQNIEALTENSNILFDNFSKVRVIYPDPLYKDVIWIGSSVGGLLRVELKPNVALKDLPVRQFIQVEEKEASISSNFVSSVVRLPNGELWIGTERGGICKVSEEGDNITFKAFSETEGLSNNVVKGIFYDDENNLWVTTNIGLNKFDTKALSFRKFGKEDGLPFEDFDYAGAKLDNGLLLLSGVDGFCFFDPKSILNDEKLPRLSFGDLKILNQVIAPSETLNDRVVLNKNLDEIQNLELKHDENIFSIEINSLHFSNPKNHYIKHRLLPENEDWIQVPSDQKTLNYHGLPPGDYVLQIKGSNSLNHWTEAKELKISISPPFWKTGWAYFLYFLIGSLLVFVGIRVLLRIQSLNHNLELEKMGRDNAKALNKAKLRFFSNISHEIKTPITLISGPVNLLMSRFDEKDEGYDELKLIQRQSKKIEQLINQVNDFQKADANLLKMHLSRFYFRDFIKELLIDYEFMAKADKKRLILEGTDLKNYVSADKDKLEIIFNNLLSNAFKHTNSDDTISIKIKRADKNLLISVSDSGKGIRKDDLPFIFDRFYQSSKNRDDMTGGSGIGLSFSKRLVDMHYGNIEVKSTVGEGTEFLIQLPIIVPENIADQTKEEAEVLSIEKDFSPISQLNEEVDLSKINRDETFAEAQVFLVEDNSDMRVFVNRILSHFFKVKAFANGRECLDAMKEEWPDIIVSDVMMPEVNGLELCKQIKSDIKTGHIPIILLTACNTIDDQIQGIKVGADAYIKKPFNTAQLIAKTEALLQNRKVLRERFRIDHPKPLEKTKINEEDRAFLEKLYELMAKNLGNQELDLDGFAKELYLNRTHFYQKVKALTNQTPYELMKIYRLQKAAELLAQQKLSVNEIFLTTGFKSRTHFSKLFKEKYKVSPGKYGKEAKK